jgi:hypothetical protein
MMLSDLAPVTTWRPRLDNPTWLGWSAVAVYLLASVACARAAWMASATPGRKGCAAAWSLLAALLLFLGVNKQLNLQTLLIVLGRRAALAGGWYHHRRLAQALFSIVFAAAGLCVLAVMVRAWKGFFAENPLAWRGLLVLLVFVLIRASSINHAIQWLGVELHDDKWCWILELCGSILISLSALRFTQSLRE